MNLTQKCLYLIYFGWFWWTNAFGCARCFRNFLVKNDNTRAWTKSGTVYFSYSCAFSLRSVQEVYIENEDVFQRWTTAYYFVTVKWRNYFICPRESVRSLNVRKYFCHHLKVLVPFLLDWVFQKSSIATRLLSLLYVRILCINRAQTVKVGYCKDTKKSQHVLFSSCTLFQEFTSRRRYCSGCSRSRHDNRNWHWNVTPDF